MTSDPPFEAAVDLVGRAGAEQFSIRYCDEVEPVVWIAAGYWPAVERWEAAGGMTPWRAVMRLLEATIDGGTTCTHCGRPSGVDELPADELLEALGPAVCFYRYDPELRTFRRSCEGVA